MSSIITSNISDGTTSVPTGYVVNGSAKAWCLNQTLVAASGWSNESFNVSSFTDNGTGKLFIDMTTAFNTTNYACIGCASTNSSNDNIVTKVAGFTTSRDHVYVYDSAVVDGPVSWLALGDLA